MASHSSLRKTTLPRREELHSDEQLCHDSLAPVLVPPLVPTSPFLTVMAVQLLFHFYCVISNFCMNFAITLTISQGVMTKNKILPIHLWKIHLSITD